MTPDPSWFEGWLRPAGFPSQVGAVMTTRGGGVSEAPYASMNLGSHVGDSPQHVKLNRLHLAQAMQAQPVYLQQVHGREVVVLSQQHLGQTPVADACVTTQPGLACCVMTADCLPVLMSAPDGRGVAAAHAGWRGLAAGVLEACVTQLCRAASCSPGEVVAWLGPCIGPRHFEVGEDVLTAYGASASEPGARFRPGQPGHWWADLPALATDRLLAVGLRAINGGVWCTFSDQRFFSYRRQQCTGRMAACIWIGKSGPGR